MNRAVLEQAGVDYEDGLRRCGGDPDLYERLLDLFAADTNYEEAKRALASKDYSEMFERTHEIKGMSGNMSLTDVYRTSSEVVAQLRAEDYDAIPATFEELGTAYTLAMDAIAKAKE